MEGSEVEQHRTAAFAFVECIKGNYPSLDGPLQFQCSQAVASIYRDRPRDIQQWADRGIFQLNALAQAVAMVRLTAMTGHTVNAPGFIRSGSRESQLFQPISVFSAVSVDPNPREVQTPMEPRDGTIALTERQRSQARSDQPASREGRPASRGAYERPQSRESQNRPPSLLGIEGYIK